MTMTPSQPPPVCPIHDRIMSWKTGKNRSTGKEYAFWSCGGKDLGGSWCKYKPPRVRELGDELSSATNSAVVSILGEIRDTLKQILQRI